MSSNALVDAGDVENQQNREQNKRCSLAAASLLLLQQFGSVDRDMGVAASGLSAFQILAAHSLVRKDFVLDCPGSEG